ncbi:MAG TPA: amidohydrolase family protein [Mycobacteriales bacterium]|nr:amidohydrolase family protein [Mycobacteriales bacterium]
MIVLDDVSVVDVVAGRTVPHRQVTLEGDRITQVRPAGSAVRGDAERPDVRGLTVLPGLIDCHVHVKAWHADLSVVPRQPGSYTALRAAGLLGAMLRRGFTTVRDAGGADAGLAAALQDGLIEGPRLFFCGHAISQTGGHGDARGAGDVCHPGGGESLSRIADGIDEVRRAARDELRRGAHFLKVMVSGGISSPTDRLDSLQYGTAELEALVEEATNAGRYVTGHAYTAASVSRAARAGFRCVEHANLIDGATARLLAERGVFMVSTLATYEALAVRGRDEGMPSDQLAKLQRVRDAGLRSLELAADAGVRLVYGTDLLGAMHDAQLTEFTIRAQAQPAAEVIQAATVNAAALLGEDDLGRVEPGARADLLLLDADPLPDIAVLTRPDTHLKAVVQGGRTVVGSLSSEPR